MAEIFLDSVKGKIVTGEGETKIHLSNGFSAKRVIETGLLEDSCVELIFDNCESYEVRKDLKTDNLFIDKTYRDAKGKLKKETITIKNYLKEYSLSKLHIKFNDEDSYDLGTKPFILTGNLKGANKLMGTNYDDIITTGKGKDIIWSYGGHDVIKAGAGDDTIWLTGDQLKEVYGEEGNDTIYSGTGENIYYLQGDFGNDTIYANMYANDTIKFVNSGDISNLTFGFVPNTDRKDLMIVSNGIDKGTIVVKNYELTNIKVNFGETTVIDDLKFLNKDEIATIYNSSGKKAAKIYASAGFDKIIGSDKNDVIYAYGSDNESHPDEITAGLGNDTIDISGGKSKVYIANTDGNDTITVGSSASVDIYFTDDSSSIDFVKNPKNNDLLIERKIRLKNKDVVQTTTLKNFFLNNTSSDIKVHSNYGTESLSSAIFTVKGNATKASTVDGTPGNDKILAGTNNDVINCKGGTDIVTPGKGDDVINCKNTICTINIDKLDGTDTLYVDANSEITLHYTGAKEDIRFYRAYGSPDDLVITRGLDFKKDIVIIKDYYVYEPKLTYQFNNTGAVEVQPTDVRVTGNYRVYPDGLIVAQDLEGTTQIITKGNWRLDPSSSLSGGDPTNDKYVVNDINALTIVNDQSNFSLNDVLQINNVKSASDLKFIFDVNATNGFCADMTNLNLCIMSSKNTNVNSIYNFFNYGYLQKGICINNYNKERYYGNIQSGRIETIQYADANGANAQEIDVQTLVYVIGKKVKDFLKGKYSSVVNLLRYSTSTAEKTALLNLYTKTNVEEILNQGYIFNSTDKLLTSGSTLSGGISSDTFYVNNNAASISHYSDITFKGGAGNDSYIINKNYGIDSNAFNGEAWIENLVISDTSGDDNYTIGNICNVDYNSGFKITDYDGNDTYNIAGNLVKYNESVIDDKAGNNNQLNIKMYASNQLGIRFDVVLDDSAPKGYTLSDLRIVEANKRDYNVLRNGYTGVTVKDYFKDNGSTMNIYAADGKHISMSNLQDVAQSIATWLKGTTFSSASEIMEQNDTSLIEYSQLYDYFDTVTWS